MNRLVLATANSGKLAEFREALSGARLISAAELNVIDFPEETGGSYEENARTKALFTARATGLPSLADDSGLEVDALRGEPGIHSARFGGFSSDRERLMHLLKRLRHVSPPERGARFVCVLVLAIPKGQVKAFRGECRGEILLSSRGEGGFGYDPVFYSPELGKSFAEATREEKRQVSHRGRALKKLLEWLEGAEAERMLLR